MHAGRIQITVIGSNLFFNTQFFKEISPPLQKWNVRTGIPRKTRTDRLTSDQTRCQGAPMVTQIERKKPAPNSHSYMVKGSQYEKKRK